MLLWRITADWQFDPDLETEVEVTFTEAAPGHIRLDLRHRNLQRYGDRAEQMRAVFDSPGGWTDTFARLSELATNPV